MRAKIAILLVILSGPASAAANSFVVEALEIEGLRRISEGTVYTYLPIGVGDVVDEEGVSKAVQALYAAGFFSDIEIGRRGGTLVVTVVERPWIERISVTGNQRIPREAIDAIVSELGLEGGGQFAEVKLGEIETALYELCYSYGMYDARIEATSTSAGDNQVAVDISIQESARTRIRQINIVGNESFEESELLKRFGLRPGGMKTLLAEQPAYSREALEGDLESMRSYYNERGYADFTILSTDVSISPDRKQLFITILIDEGARYTVSSVDVLGGTQAVPTTALAALVRIAPGQIFDRRLIEESAELIRSRLGQDGHAFAKVEIETQLEESKADITFLVRPGSKIYVRRIELQGIARSNDEALRCEISQAEGAYLNSIELERSRLRLESLPHIDSAEIEIEPVPGEGGLVDVIVDMVELPTRRYGGGGGYTDSQRVNLNGYFSNESLLGTGQRLSLDFTASEFRSAFNITHTSACKIPRSLSRQVALRFRDIDQLTSASSEFQAETGKLSLQYGYRTTQFQALSFGVALQDTSLESTSMGSLQTREWLANNGSVSMPDADLLRSEFLAAELLASWRYDTRDNSLFPRRGARHRLTLTAVVPGSEVEYYTIEHDLEKYWPIAGDWTTRLRTEFAFGDAYGSDTTSLPPYLNWFAGGAGSVRGFREKRLGPRDSLNNPYGGNLLVSAQLELLLPAPPKWRDRVRASLFFDIGNAFSTGGVSFVNAEGEPLDFSFDTGALRQSAGLAIDWRSPIGLIRTSYGIPLNADENNPDPFLRDQVDRFQISFGVSF